MMKQTVITICCCCCQVVCKNTAQFLVPYDTFGEFILFVINCRYHMVSAFSLCGKVVI